MINLLTALPIKNSVEIYKSFYDLGKLTFAGIVLFGIQQHNLSYVMMGAVASIVFFTIGNLLEMEVNHA